MPKPILSTIFWRPVNLLCSKETRAASRHTSTWGLNRLLRRSAILERTVQRNLEDRLLSKQIELPELVKLAVKGGSKVREMAEQIILDQTAFHKWAVQELGAYLNDGKLRFDGEVLVEGHREVEYVETAYPNRMRAQAILRHIGRLHDDKLGEEIGRILSEAPLAFQRSRVIF